MKCLTIAPESGWLTDADICEPKYPPAPYKEFAGPPTKAFRHFDKEMAEATVEYHKGKFVIPDATRRFPVPRDWPGGEAR